MRKDPGISITYLIEDGMGLYLTEKAQCFEVQIRAAYYTQWSKRPYHVGQSDPLCDISQGETIGRGKTSEGKIEACPASSMGSKQSSSAKGSSSYIQVIIWLK